MNTLFIEKNLAAQHKYKKLPDVLSAKYRKIFLENIPEFLSIKGDNKRLYSLSGTPICNNYDKIVVGDYGAFIEFSEPASKFIVKQGQEYRFDTERYSNIKYYWYTTNDDSDIKIYLQRKSVTYADYKPGKYYVSVHEVTLGE